MLITRRELNELIKKEVKNLGSQRILAEDCGCTPHHVSDVIHNRRNPGKKLLKHLGLIKAVVYIRSDDLE